MDLKPARLQCGPDALLENRVRMGEDCDVGWPKSFLDEGADPLSDGVSLAPDISRAQGPRIGSVEQR